MKKTFRNVLLALSVIGAALFTTGCPKPVDPVEIVEPVSFSIDSGKVSQGTVVTLTTTSEADIYASIDEVLTASNYTTVGSFTDTVEITKNCKVYAIAVSVATGATSEVTSAEYQVTGPSPVTFTVTSGNNPENEGYVYNNATVALSSDEGAEIYYSTTETFNAEDYESQTKYENPIVISGARDTDVTIYAVAVKANEEGVMEPSRVKSSSYKVTIKFVPLSETNNYALDGGIAGVVSKIGTSETDVNINTVISGYVTISNNKTTNGTLYVQDKNAAIVVFGYNLDSTKYQIGDYVSLKVVTGKIYNGYPEVTSYSELTSNAENNAVEMYYVNLNGKTDFSGLESVKLCGIKANAADYQSDSAYIYTTLNDKAYAHFGYVATFNNGAKVEFSVAYSKPAEVLSDEVSALVNSVEPVRSSKTLVGKDELFELASTTPDAEIYYSVSTVLTADNYASAGTKYTNSISLDTLGMIDLSVIAVKEGYTSTASVITYTVIADNQVAIVFPGLEGLTTANEGTDTASSKINDNLTITYNKATASKYNPRTDGKVLQIYGGNTVVFTSTKTITNLQMFNCTDVSNLSASSGVFDAANGEWTGLTKELTFTNSTTKQAKFTSVIITFLETEANYEKYATDVVIDKVSGAYSAGTQVTLSTTEDDADIYYSTSKALNILNYKDGSIYSSPITITDGLTVYAILIQKGDAPVKYSNGVIASYSISLGTASLTTSIADGDKIILYNASAKGVMATTVTSKGFGNEAATISSNTIELSKNMMVLDVKAVTGGYELLNGGKYLSTTGNNNLTLADASSETTVFTITNKTDTTEIWYVSGSKAQIEYYNSNWTTYGTSKTGSAYEIKIFKVNAE